MARLNTNAELWATLTQFGVIRDSTVAALALASTVAPAAGSTSVILSSAATGLSTGDEIRLGPTGGAQVALVVAISTTGATDALSFRSPLAEALLGGSPVVKVTRTDLGDLMDDGVQLEVQSDIQTINAATQRNAYAHHVAHTDGLVTVGLENISWENLLASVGDDEANIKGGTTASDPTVVDWLPDNFDTVKPIHFYAQGTLKDGTSVEVQFFDCDIDPAKTMNLARGQDAPLNLGYYPRVIRWIKPLA